MNPLHHVERLMTECEINFAHNAIVIEERIEEVDGPVPVKNAILRMLRDLHEGDDEDSPPPIRKRYWKGWFGISQKLLIRRTLNGLPAAD